MVVVDLRLGQGAGDAVRRPPGCTSPAPRTAFYRAAVASRVDSRWPASSHRGPACDRDPALAFALGVLGYQVRPDRAGTSAARPCHEFFGVPRPVAMRTRSISNCSRSGGVDESRAVDDILGRRHWPPLMGPAACAAATTARAGGSPSTTGAAPVGGLRRTAAASAVDGRQQMRSMRFRTSHPAPAGVPSTYPVAPASGRDWAGRRQVSLELVHHGQQLGPCQRLEVARRQEPRWQR